MKEPVFQKTVTTVGYIALGAISLGSALDSFSIPISIIKFRLASIITSFIIFLWILSIVFINKGFLLWQTKSITDGKVQYNISKISKINKGTYLPILGAILLIWTAAFINHGHLKTQTFKPYNEAFNFSVLVRGEKGQFDIDSDLQGKIVLDVDVSTREATIGKNGSTIFTQIEGNYKGQLKPLTLKAWGFLAVNPDLQYELSSTPVYLFVKRDSTFGIISGYIRNESGAPIQEVSIFVDGESTHSDDKGHFKLQMPKQKISIYGSYILNFSKPEYFDLTELYVPAGKPVQVFLKKR